MLEHIIKHFCKDSRFINDIDGLMSYLDSLHMEDKEKANVLLEVYNYNNKVLSTIKTENKTLQKVTSVQEEIVTDRKAPFIPEEHIFEHKSPKTAKIDVSNYISKIKEIDNLDDLVDIIPDYSLDSNRDIINVIILKLVEDIVDIKRMLYQERGNIDSTTKEYFEEEIALLQSKIDFIRDLSKSNDADIEDQSEPVNELIFLSTKRGNPCIYQDLKDIPAEQYDAFVVLLDSIRSGKFSNLRTFNNNVLLNDLREVKYCQARVVFRQVSSNCYVIICMLVKKVNKDSYYQTNLANRHDLLLQNFDEIVLLANSSEEYLEENRNIMLDVYSILEGKDKVKKVGDTNV